MFQSGVLRWKLIIEVHQRRMLIELEYIWK
jgi:hypothetical protein